MQKRGNSMMMVDPLEPALASTTGNKPKNEDEDDVYVPVFEDSTKEDVVDASPHHC